MNVEFEFINIGKKKESHSHVHAQFVIPVDGCVFLELEGKSQVLDGKSLGYVPPNSVHRFSSDVGVNSLLINLGEQLVKEIDRFTFVNNAPFILDKQLITIIDILKTEVRNSVSNDSLKYLFFYIYDKLAETRTYRSVSYIHENFQYDISMTALAELECYNQNYFSIWFKKQIGLSPVSYLKRVRVEETKKLLLTTKYNLTQIAMQCGYSHSSTMCKIFKEFEGCTPSEYRSIYS